MSIGHLVVLVVVMCIGGVLVVVICIGGVLSWSLYFLWLSCGGGHVCINIFFYLNTKRVRHDFEKKILMSSVCVLISNTPPRTKS
jgi:hypothetical protein